MSTIREISNPWRDRYQTASFRGAIFHTEMDVRIGGRRVAPHEYPKRNIGYAEDMGRRAVRFTVTGYLIGPNYLTLKDRLIAALEEDGPGTLRLPLPYKGGDMEVMVQNYTVTESRERGGMCGIELDCIEAGKPGFSDVAASTPSEVNKVAAALETQVFTSLSASISFGPFSASVSL